jgi:hypothetical protein
MLFVTTFAGRGDRRLSTRCGIKRFAQACVAVRFWSRHDCSATRPTIRRDPRSR